MIFWCEPDRADPSREIHQRAVNRPAPALWPSVCNPLAVPWREHKDRGQLAASRAPGSLAEPLAGPWFAVTSARSLA
jgi:hypothetical protein